MHTNEHENELIRFVSISVYSWLKKSTPKVETANAHEWTRK